MDVKPSRGLLSDLDQIPDSMGRYSRRSLRGWWWLIGFPSSGSVEDSYRQVAGHARHTMKKPRR